MKLKHTILFGLLVCNVYASAQTKPVDATVQSVEPSTFAPPGLQTMVQDINASNDTSAQCIKLKQKVEDDLKSKKIENYSLDLMPNSQKSTGEVVGRCSKDKTKLVLVRLSNQSTAPIISQSEIRKKRAEVEKNESRKFVPDGKNVVVSSSDQIPSEIEAAFESTPKLANMSQTTTSSTTQINAIAADLEKTQFQAKPGEPINVSIGIGTLNRFATDFQEVVIDTIDELQIKTVGNVFMLATDTLTPVTIIAREKDFPDSAVMINIIPQEGIAAKDIKISASKSYSSQNRNFQSNTTPNQGVANLKNLLTDIARGKIPSGFSLTHVNPEQSTSSNCQTAGVRTALRQTLSGSANIVKIYKVENVSNSVIELDERLCTTNQNQVAAAYWPKLVLNKGEKSELYVIESIVDQESLQSSRPSSID